MTEQASAKEPEVLATFEIKLRPDANVEELTNLQEKLHKIARSTPTIGAIKAQNWNGDDGALLTIFTFKSMAAMNEFVRHPEHLAIMQRAKEFFSVVRTQISTVERQSETILEG